MDIDQFACGNCGHFTLDVAYDPGCTFARCTRCGWEGPAVPDYDPEALVEKMKEGK